MAIVGCLNVIVERCASEIRPHLQAIVDFLPVLWLSDHQMLKATIVSLFVHVVKGLGDESLGLHQGLAEILRPALDPSNESHVFLFDDALDLWLATIERSPELTPAMADLVSFMPQLLTVQSENLRCCLEILKAYVAFGNFEFAQVFLPKFDLIFAQILQQMRSEGQTAVLR